MNKEIMDYRVTKDFNMLGDIFSVFKLANKYFSNLCEKNNIKHVEFEVLYLLYTSKDNKMKMSLLGDNLEMARSGVTLLVDRMALEGLVIRRQDIDDRRITNVIITEKGNEIMENVFHKNSIFKLSPLDFMKAEEKEILYKLIIEIKEKLEDKSVLI